MISDDMTGAEYVAAIAHLGLSQSAAGTLFGAHPVTGKRWAKTGPPKPVAMLLRAARRLEWTLDYLILITGQRS